MGFQPVHPKRGAFSPVRASAWASAASALGAYVGADCVTFAVYSRHATRVLLEIYPHAIGAARQFDYWMSKGSDDIWRAHLSAVPVGTCYGFRCWGPNWEFSPSWTRGNSVAGFRADVDTDGTVQSNKCSRPYARELSHDRENNEMKEHYGHNAGMYGSGGDPMPESTTYVPCRAGFDTGAWAPKAVSCATTRRSGQARTSQKDSIIYEAHSRAHAPSVVATLSNALLGIRDSKMSATCPSCAALTQRAGQHGALPARAWYQRHRAAAGPRVRQRPEP